MCTIIDSYSAVTSVQTHRGNTSRPLETAAEEPSPTFTTERKFYQLFVKKKTKTKSKKVYVFITYLIGSRMTQVVKYSTLTVWICLNTA